jgi:hypothetical protein
MQVAVTMLLSLDGVLEEPAWTVSFSSGVVLLRCQPDRK